MPLNKIMNEENMGHLYNGVLLSGKIKDILNFYRQMDRSRKNHTEWITQTQKANIICVHHQWLLDIKQRKTSLQAIIPEKLQNKKDPWRDIHEYA